MLSGFGTLGLARSNTNDAAFILDMSQPKGVTRGVNATLDSRLGIQLTHPLGETLRGTLQAVSKYQYDGTFRPNITWAFLGWNPVPNILIRAGRTEADVFMNSESRDVGYAFLWIRIPTEYLGAIPSPSLDGLDVADTFSLGSQSVLRVKVILGMSNGTLPLPADTYINLNGGKTFGIVSELQDGPWRGRLAYTQFHPERDFPQVPAVQAGLDQYATALRDPGLAETAASLSLSSSIFRWYCGAFSYEQGAIQAMAGLNRLTTGNLAMSPDNWTGMLSMGYRLGTLVPYGTWSRIVSSRPPLYTGALPLLGTPAAQALTQGIGQLAAGYKYDQYSLASGLRWDFAAKAAFKFQVDWIHTHNGPSLMADPQPGWTGRATLLSAVVDFLF